MNVFIVAILIAENKSVSWKKNAVITGVGWICFPDYILDNEELSKMVILPMSGLWMYWYQEEEF
jgi:hypothetical protein